jgi:uncharacterized RDD family membrane protein YckC
VAIAATIVAVVSGFSSDLHMDLVIGGIGFNFDTNAGGIIWTARAWPYFAGLESSAWQASLGKRVLGMVVTDGAGRRISFGRATSPGTFRSSRCSSATSSNRSRGDGRRSTT